MNNNNSLLRHLAWLVVAIVGAAALGVVALRRGEAINALWIVVAAVAIYLVAYRYYSLFIASKVMQLDPNRATPAVLNNDGLDYVPTNKHILFGHHFAAIAGAGPLVGPVLAAQMGYLPGTLWLIAGVVLAGAVQDFMVLFISSRRNGRSLGELVREEMGQVAGTIALFGAFLIMIIILAVLALIVVKALADSPWGMFTVLATIPIALFMGVYMRFIRPGRIGEISIIGVFLLLGSIWLGGQVAASPEWAPHFTFSGIQITWMLIGYGAVASVLPVWLLLAPRDYLSTFLQDRHHHRPGDRHPDRHAGTEDAGPDPVHRRHRPGLERQPVPVPVHHHRLRRGVRLPRADLLGDHAEAAQPRARRPLHRLRRHADGVLRGDHGDGRRLGDRAGHLLRHEQPAGGGRRRRQRGGRDRQQLGLRHHAGATHPDRSGHRRDHHPGPCRRRADPGGGDRAHPPPGAAGREHHGLLVPLRDPLRGLVHPSPRWTPAPVPGASCCRTCWATSCRR